MLPLWLLAGHMVGDFILATRWQAATKFDDAWARTRHVLGYCVPFVPVCFAYASADRALAALAVLFVLHWLTDCRRYRSTLGDVIGWHFNGRTVWVVDAVEPVTFELTGAVEGSIGGTATASHTEHVPLPPNPWEPIALFIDQGLHVLQLALVGTLFLT